MSLHSFSISCCSPSRQACSWGESTSTPSTSKIAPRKSLTVPLLSLNIALVLPRQLVGLLRYLLDELVEGVGELLDALLLEHIGYVLVGYASFFEILQELAGLVDVFLDGLADVGMVLHVLDGGLRHGVDRVRADEVLDVHHVGVLRVLGRGGCPQGPL